MFNDEIILRMLNRFTVVSASYLRGICCIGSGKTIAFRFMYLFMCKS